VRGFHLLLEILVEGFYIVFPIPGSHTAAGGSVANEVPDFVKSSEFRSKSATYIITSVVWW
jgi:hypothetical protein